MAAVNAEKQIEGVNHIQLKYFQFDINTSGNIQETVLLSNQDEIRMVSNTYYVDLSGISVGYFCQVFCDSLLSSTAVKTELRPDMNFIQFGTDLI